MISQVFKEPKVDQEILTRLIPSLMSLGIHEHIVSIKNKQKSLTKSNEEEGDGLIEVKEVEVKSKKEKQSKKKSKAKKVSLLIFPVLYSFVNFLANGRKPLFGNFRLIIML